jgi:hypothetical protein
METMAIQEAVDMTEAWCALQDCQVSSCAEAWHSGTPEPGRTNRRLHSWGRVKWSKENAMVFILGRKPNATPVAKHFNSVKPVTEEYYFNPSGNRRRKRRPMVRLSFGVISPKENRSIRELFNLIECGPLECQSIFPDTSFILKPLPQQFWGVGQGRVIGFPEITVGELSGWLQNPLHNQNVHEWLARSLKEIKDQPVDPDKLGRMTRVLGSVGHELINYTVAVANKQALQKLGYDYYVNMLSLRKRLGIAEAKELAASLSREPTEQEVRNHLNNNFHARIAPLAFKGWKDQGKKNFVADEELVVTAVLTAIAGVQDTLILTWDNDVFDQFTKLAELMASDYTCFRWAEVHALSPDCPMFPMDIPPNVTGPGAEAFSGKQVQQICIATKDVEKLPPSEFTPVQVYCVMVGNNCVDPKISVAAFCFEAEMGRLLEAKTASDGKNTNRFPGRNMHAGTDFSQGNPGTLFLLCEEKHLNYEGVNVSWLDLQHALKCDPLIARKCYIA